MPARNGCVEGPALPVSACPAQGPRQLRLVEVGAETRAAEAHHHGSAPRRHRAVHLHEQKGKTNLRPTIIQGQADSELAGPEHPDCPEQYPLASAVETRGSPMSCRFHAPPQNWK